MCGCKGCQEITTLDLTNNIETITQLPTKECGPINSTIRILTCECGITLDIYNSAGILIETTQGGGYNEGEENPLFFEITTSTVWESQLGTEYVLTFTYNNNLDRWELSYYNETIDDNVLIGIYETEYACPSTLQGWDLDCISFIFIARGVPYLVTWSGQYLNGRKFYTTTFALSGTDYNWEFYFNNILNRWEVKRIQVSNPSIIEISHSAGDFSCIGNVSIWYDQSGNPNDYSDSPLGVSNYNIRVSPIDCQCCDEKLTVRITVTGKPPTEIEVIATIEVDEFGNHLIYNGYPYYILHIGLDTYYIFFNSIVNAWVVGPVVSEDVAFITQNNSTSLCPFGYYNVDDYFLRFWVTGYDCGNQTAEDFCNKIHTKQCEFASKVLKYLKHLQFGNSCCEELDDLKNDKRILEILNCYDTRDIESNTTNYNVLPYSQIKKLLSC